MLVKWDIDVYCNFGIDYVGVIYSGQLGTIIMEFCIAETQGFCM